MSLSRGQGTVFPHTDAQKTLGREVRAPCYGTTTHVSLGYHERGRLVVDYMVDAKVEMRITNAAAK